MKLFLLTVVCCIGALCSAERPRLIFPDASLTHLRNDAGRTKAIALAEKKQKNPMEALSLAYRLTGNEKYAQKVRDLLWRDCGTPKPGAPPKQWGGGLNGAHKCYDLAVGFDSIYEFLTPEERKTIARNLTDRFITPMLKEWLLGESRTTVIDSMGHNWWSSCVFLPGVAALAVAADDPRVEAYLPLIAKGSAEWFNYPGSTLNNKPATFDREGGFYESVGYGSYALTGYLTLRLAWRNSGREALPSIAFLDKTGDFFLNSCYPNSNKLMSLNFGDSSIHAVGSAPLVLLWANKIQKDRFLWYLNMTATSDYKEAIRNDSALGLVYFPSESELKKAPATPDLPTMTTYRDMGWVMMRNSWQKDATLLAVKSGFTWNHAHADAGSFMLFHKGQNLLIDSGNCWYPHPQYDQYYRQSTAHNVVLFDGEGENPEDTYFGSKFPGKILYPIEAGNLKYVLADATGPTAQNFSRNYRSFLWIDDVILVIDDLKTHRFGVFEWLIHAEDAVKRKGSDLHISKGNVQITLRPLFPERLAGDFGHDTPERLQLVEKSGLKDHAQNTPVPYYALKTPEKARVMKFINAILLNPGQAPQIERLEPPTAIGVRLSKDGRVTEVCFNLNADGRMRHRNANNTLGGFDSDAYLLAVTGQAGKEPERIFIVNGSYLRRGGEVLFDSLTKVSALRENGKITVFRD